MNNFFDDFEADIFGAFSIYKESRQEEIQEKLRLETEKKQAKLEAEALAKHEAEQAAEEAKKAAEEAKGIKQDAKKKAPPAKKGQDAKPQLDVPQLEVPQVTPFQSESGNKYIRERPLEEIVDKLMLPPPEEEEDPPQEKAEQQESQPNLTPAGKKEEDKRASQLKDKKASVASIKDAKEAAKKPAAPAKEDARTKEQSPALSEADEEEKKEDEAPKFEPNDYMEKSEMRPPQDPYGNQTMVPDLVIDHAKILKMLEDALVKTMKWLMTDKENYNQKVVGEGKELCDKSVEELDQNLRKQWPRKGRLEVEVFQERKGQITAHNKKYERHVRTCLEKYNLLQEQWGLVMEQIGAEFKDYKEKHEKLKDKLPSGKNLAELQGMSRKEKDSHQIFSDKCQEFHDSLLDLGQLQPDSLIRQNSEMLKSCALIESGGNYAEAEVAWYRGQMDEIDNIITESKTKRAEETEKVVEDMNALKKDPTADFNVEYNTSIQQLSAKEGLGKTFGQPRRLTQERLRAEMTKCEQAQRGIDQLIDKLEDLCE